MWHCTPAELLCRQLKPIHQQMQQHLFLKHLLCINMQITPADSDLKASCFCCCCCFKELEPATAQSYFLLDFWLLLQYSWNIQILTREGYSKEFLGFFLVESKYFQVFSYQRDLSMVNSESNLNCIPCQSLLIWVAVGARRPHMFWQVNGEMIWETARQADTVIKQPARDSVPILWGNFLQNVPDLLSRRW